MNERDDRNDYRGHPMDVDMNGQAPDTALRRVQRTLEQDYFQMSPTSVIPLFHEPSFCFSNLTNEACRKGCCGGKVDGRSRPMSSYRTTE